MVVGTGAVLVVGVPGMPTQYQASSTMPLQWVPPRLGFHDKKWESEKAPNIETIVSHDSPSRWYQWLHSMVRTDEIDAGADVAVGGMAVMPLGPTTR